MTLDELKLRLGKLAKYNSDELLELLLSDAFSFVSGIANSEFTPNQYPRSINSILAKYVRNELMDKGNIQSQTLAGMTQTYITPDKMRQVIADELSNLGLRYMRFTPFTEACSKEIPNPLSTDQGNVFLQRPDSLKYTFFPDGQ